MRRMGPLGADHPAVRDGTTCAACDAVFRTGDYVALVPLGPGADKDSQQRVSEGRAYNAVCAIVHWDCSDKGRT